MKHEHYFPESLSSHKLPHSWFGKVERCIAVCESTFAAQMRRKRRHGTGLFRHPPAESALPSRLVPGIAAARPLAPLVSPLQPALIKKEEDKHPQCCLTPGLVAVQMRTKRRAQGRMTQTFCLLRAPPQLPRTGTSCCGITGRPWRRRKAHQTG